MRPGSWFEYRITEERSDLRDGKVWKERYVVVSVEDERIVFDHYENGKRLEQVIGNVNWANGIIGTDGLSKVGDEELDTSLGRISACVYGSDRCGGGTEIFVDSHGIMYKSVESQLWSMGVRHSVTRELVDRGWITSGRLRPRH